MTYLYGPGYIAYSYDIFRVITGEGNRFAGVAGGFDHDAAFPLTTFCNGIVKSTAYQIVPPAFPGAGYDVGSVLPRPVYAVGHLFGCVSGVEIHAYRHQFRVRGDTGYENTVVAHRTGDSRAVCSMADCSCAVVYTTRRPAGICVIAFAVDVVGKVSVLFPGQQWQS